MNPRAAFGLSTLMSLLSAIVFAVLFARPWLRNINTEQALIWLVAPHMVRFIGLSFLVPGVVSGSLPKAWAKTRRLWRLCCWNPCDHLHGGTCAHCQLGNRNRVDLQCLGFGRSIVRIL
jgi:hypothetical protein